jgi:hypothetical protein
MADIRPMQAIRDDDEIQPQMRYRMRLWALNVAAGLSDNFTMHAEDGSLPACDRRAPRAAVEAVLDVDGLYEGRRRSTRSVNA